MAFFPPPPRLCDCGSGLESEEQFDARGICIGACCDRCRAAKLAEFRPEVLSDEDYECDEDIEPDDDGVDWGDED